MSKNFVAIHEIKPVLTLDKTIYLGFSIFDLSKFLLYEFHCKYIKTKFIAKLLFTDRDSLVYEIKTRWCLWRFLWRKKNCLSLAIIHNSEFFDLVNKKVIGKMKDELIHEFVGLKSKMYSIVGKYWLCRLIGKFRL